MNDLKGHVYGDLTVIEPTPHRQHGNVVWACLCVCGKRVDVNANKLRTGDTKSCGCRRGRVTRDSNVARTKHGHAQTYSQTRTYKSWNSMIARCENPRHTQFRHYGGRGVTVDPSWRSSFDVFLADMGPRPEGHTLDRIDPNEPYSPTNCRWATPQQQAQNTRSNVWLTLNGESLILSDWAKRLGGKPNALRMRLKKGWPLERALTEPFEPRRPRKITNPVPLEERQARSAFKHRYRHLSGDLTYDEWQWILSKHGQKCSYCGTDKNLTMDHVFPLSKGGCHTASNVVPACRSCNSSKQDRVV